MESPSLSRPTSAKQTDWIFNLLIACWAFQFAVNLAFVVMFGTNIPVQDDFHLLPGLLGTDAFDINWIWVRLNQHRYPVARFLIWGLGHATGGDLRAAELLNTALPALGGLLLLVALRRDRGRSSPLDFLVLPFSMSWIHAWNYVQPSGLLFILYAFLSFLFLSALLLRLYESRTGITVMLVLTVLMALNGGLGLIAASAWTLFFVFSALVFWRRNSGGDRSLALWLGMAAVGISALVVTFLLQPGLTEEDGFPRMAGTVSTPVIFLRVLSMAVGPVVRPMWYDDAGIAVALMVAILLLVGAMGLIGLVRDSANRLRVFGILCVILGSTLIAMAIGLVRTWAGPTAGLWFHYSTAMAPTPIAIYLIARTCPQRHVRSIVHLGLAALVVIVMASSYSFGWAFGQSRLTGAARLTQQIRAGYPDRALVLLNYEYFYPWAYDRFSQALDHLRLREHGLFSPSGTTSWIQPLATLQFRDVPLRVDSGTERSLKPVAEGAVTWSGNGAVLTTVDAGTGFELPPMTLWGKGSRLLRIHLMSPVESTATLILEYAEQADEPLMLEAPVQAGPNVLEFLLPPGEWNVEQLRFMPGAGPQRFRLRSISFLELPLEEIVPVPSDFVAN